MAALWLSVGLVAFLAGLRGLTRGLEHLGGRAVRRSLGRFGRDPVPAWLAGAAAAALCHSSGLVTVAAVGLVEAGVLGFPAALGAVLGANVGTTATAQLLSFSTGPVGLAALVAGAALWVAGRWPSPRRVRLVATGETLWGTGLVFLGMEALGETFGGQLPGWFPGWLGGMAGRPVPGVLAGAALTGAIQSSTVFVGVVMSLAERGLLTLPGAIHLVLGGNIGSCVPGVLAGAAGGWAGWWVGVANLVFNVAGVAAVIPFVPWLAALVAETSQSFARQVANAHALFNLVTAVAALPLAGPVGRWLEGRLPEGGVRVGAAKGRRGAGGAPVGPGQGGERR